jgi:hypothetical protein
MGERIALRDDPAQREAREVKLPEARPVGDRLQILHQRVEAVGTLRLVGQAMTALVIGERPIARAQRLDHLLPVVEAGTDAMNEKERNALARQPIAQPDPVPLRNAILRHR